MLICVDGSYYLGLTDDLAQRISDDRHGKGSTRTKATKPVIFAWYEPNTYRVAAQAHERRIKGWGRAKKNLLARGMTPSLKFGVRPWLPLA